LLSSAEDITIQKTSVPALKPMCFYCVHKAELRTICCSNILPKYFFKEKTQTPYFRASINGHQHVFHSRPTLYCTFAV
jgi:hypothetical protein